MCTWSHCSTANVFYTIAALLLHFSVSPRRNSLETHEVLIQERWKMQEVNVSQITWMCCYFQTRQTKRCISLISAFLHSPKEIHKMPSCGSVIRRGIDLTDCICGAHLTFPQPPFLFWPINFPSPSTEVFSSGNGWLKAISWSILLFAAFKVLLIFSERRLYCIYIVCDQNSFEMHINHAGQLVNFWLFTCPASYQVLVHLSTYSAALCLSSRKKSYYGLFYLKDFTFKDIMLIRLCCQVLD